MIKKEDWQRWYNHKSNKDIWIENEERLEAELMTERERDQKLLTLKAKNI